MDHTHKPFISFDLRLSSPLLFSRSYSLLSFVFTWAASNLVNGEKRIKMQWNCENFISEDANVFWKAAFVNEFQDPCMCMCWSLDWWSVGYKKIKIKKHPNMVHECDDGIGGPTQRSTKFWFCSTPFSPWPPIWSPTFSERFDWEVYAGVGSSLGELEIAYLLIMSSLAVI